MNQLGAAPNQGPSPPVSMGFGNQFAAVHSHIAYFWETEAEFRDAMGFLEVGLRGSDRCVVFGFHQANAKVWAELESRGLDVTELEREGRLVVVEGQSQAAEMLKALGEVFQKALAARTPLIRLLGNIGWREKDWPEDRDLLAFEAQVTEVAKVFPCVVLCLYDVWTLPGFIVRRGGFATHPLACQGHELCENPFFTPQSEYANQLEVFDLARAERPPLNEQCPAGRPERYLTEACPLGIFYADPEGRCAYANRRWSEMAGVSWKNAIGRRWWEVLPGGAEGERVAEVWARSVQKREAVEVEFSTTLEMGEVRYFQAEATPEEGAAEMPFGWAGTIIDITERKKTEQALRQRNAELESRIKERQEQLSRTSAALQLEGVKRSRSAEVARRNQERFVAFMSNLPGLAFIKDARHRYVYVNDQFEHLFGRPRSAWLAKTDAELWPEPTAARFAASEERLLQNHGPLVSLETIPQNDGDHEWLIHRFLILEEFGEPEVVAGVGVDVTDLRRVETALRNSEHFANATLNALSAQLCVLDERGTIVAVNESWRNFAKENPPAPKNWSIGANYLSVCEGAQGSNSEEAKPFAEGVRAVMEGEVAEFALEYPCHSPTAQRWFIARVTRIPDYQPLHLVVAHENITERKLGEQKIIAAVKKEAVLRREIHHRVKNNLQIISSLLYLQSAQVTDPHTREVLRESRSRARSIGLIHEFLCQREDLTKINFADYARQLSGDLLTAYRVGPDEITVSVEGPGVFLNIDTAIPCGLIVTELISNSLKYAFPKKQKGVIAVALTLGESGSLTLTVRDNGVGYPPGFDWRMATSMGLKLVRDLARQLDGVVTIQNSSGAEVTLTFPNPVPIGNGAHSHPDDEGS